jgi:hypothetical protein
VPPTRASGRPGTKQLNLLATRQIKQGQQHGGMALATRNVGNYPEYPRRPKLVSPTLVALVTDVDGLGSPAQEHVAPSQLLSGAAARILRRSQLSSWMLRCLRRLGPSLRDLGETCPALFAARRPPQLHDDMHHLHQQSRCPCGTTGRALCSDPEHSPNVLSRLHLSLCQPAFQSSDRSPRRRIPSPQDFGKMPLTHPYQKG